MPSTDLKSITATWTTPPSSELWDRLKSLGGTETKADEYVRLGPTLPTSTESRIATAFVHQCDNDELHWILAVQPPPEGDAPESVRARNDEIGGPAGLALLLSGALPAGLPNVGAFRIRFHVPAARFTCSAIPVVVEKTSGHEAALRFARQAHLEQVGYRFDGGAGGIEEIAIVYLHKQQQYRVVIEANGPLKLASGILLPFADDVIDLAMTGFFIEMETRS